MGSKYPVLKPDEIIKALNEFGFRVVSQKGSHIKLRRDGLIVKTVIVPNHYEVVIQGPPSVAALSIAASDFT